MRGGGKDVGAPLPLPVPFASFDLSDALLIAGLRSAVEACVEIECAGEDSRVPDSGDEDRWSRCSDETVEDARSLEGMRVADGRSCNASLLARWHFWRRLY